jgi:hypothetical protein
MVSSNSGVSLATRGAPRFYAEQGLFQPGEMLVVEQKQGLTAELLLDPARRGLVGRGGPPRLAEVRV